MNRQRMFGSDVPFMGWLRAQGVDLPSNGRDCGVVATDVDFHIHRYLSCVDRIGSREVQTLMQIEVKTRNAEPKPSQLDTLFKVHATTKRWSQVNGQAVRNFGVSVLKLSGTTPLDSSHMWWGRFHEEFAILKYRAICIDTLFQLLRFEIDPENFCTIPFRRHHSTKTIVTKVTTELGFECEEHIVCKS